MNVKDLVKKEKHVWHDHFVPGLLAGFLVALIAFFFEMTGSNIALFASIGASAVILTHKYRHHLTMLRTIIGSYFLAGVISVALLGVSMDPALRMGIVVVLVTMALYSFNLFHPPAISAALAIVLYDRPLIDLVYVLGITMIAFIIIRFAIYAVHEHLPTEEFLHEFLHAEP